MFLYLNICPKNINPWIQFYHNLVQNSSPARILLGVNRMLKTHQQNNEIKLQHIATTFLNKVMSAFHFHQKDIECLIYGNKCVIIDKTTLGNF